MPDQYFEDAPERDRRIVDLRGEGGEPVE
jgi:hypothetical protein